jgi:hypothetical protein
MNSIKVVTDISIGLSIITIIASNSFTLTECWRSHSSQERGCKHAENMSHKPANLLFDDASYLKRGHLMKAKMDLLSLRQPS